jgi:thiol-disulfide isomerase/thioredoxin
MLAALALTLMPLVEGPFHDLSFPAALERAGAEEKVVMVDFFTTWCGPCKKLDATTWKDPAVLAWLGEHTIALKLDAEVEVELARSYGIRAYPTMVFARPDGSELGRLVGYKDADGFLGAARDLLAGKTPLDTARETFAASDQGPSARMSLARELERAGEVEEAAEHLLWCWDHGVEHTPSFSAVRVSFLASQIAALARRDPELRAAMAARRDAAAAVLLAPGTPREEAQEAARDLAALDERVLGTPRRSLETYDQLGEDHKTARVALSRQLLEVLVEERRYEDALLGSRNPVQSVRIRVQTLEQEPEGSEAREELGLPSMRETLLRLLLERGGILFEACAGAGRTSEAREIADLLLEQTSTGALYADLVERALRADTPALARELAARGREALEGEELETLERAARGLGTRAGD